MASNNDHQNSSGSSNRAYEIVKHIIDIEDEPDDLNTPKWSIYKVPRNLRTLEEPAYTPQLVSIGPLHYGLKDLKPMQKHKLRYLDLFRGRVKNNIKPLDEFKDYLRSQEDHIRQCYAEKLDIDDEKLVEMMFLDSIFIVELFLRVPEKQKYSDDIILKQSWLNKSIERDLLLLENQIPLFILQELYKNFVPASDPAKKEHPTFVDLARHYFNSFPPYNKCDEETGSSDFNSEPSKNGTVGFEKEDSSGSIQLMMKNCGGYEKGDSSSSEETGSSDSSNGETLNDELKHFTDLIRSFYICKRFGDVSNVIKGSPLKTATNLPESGVSFEKGKNRPLVDKFQRVPILRSFSKWTRLHEPSNSPLRTATKLRESGVSFEKVKNRPLLDIKFQRVPILSWFLCFGCIPHSSYFKARLQIPELKVDYTTECVLRNLIAFEQCHYPNEPYICNYVSFIDSLIHTKDDVELLVEKEVIVHELGSDKEVATLVNGLCKHVVVDNTCYRNLISDLNKHYQRQWNRTMAALMLVYFRDAWRASSTLVATAVLVFTIFNFCRVVRLVLDLGGGYKKP